MQKCGVFTFLLTLFFLLVTPLISRSDDSSKRENDRNGGYFLLHDLLSQEEQLPFIMDIKTAPPELENFAIHISKVCKEGLAIMDRMKDADPRMNWERNPLPKIEQDIRASVSDEKEHQLLLEPRGPEFDRALLVSQAEASKYTANIAKVLAELDPKHATEFNKISTQWHGIYDETFRLLRNY